MLMIGWLALLICLWTAGDLVIDLVFEFPEIASDIDTTSEPPDNAAEHLLMPSERADYSPAGTPASAPAKVFDASSIVVTVPDNTALKAAPSLHPPPRNIPVSFSIPLRI